MKISLKIGILGIFGLQSAFSIATAQQSDVGRIIQSAKQGAVVSLPGVLESEMRDVAYFKKVVGRTQLLMSDDPEYIADTAAVVLKEPVKAGDVRLYVYNVNGVVSPQKMSRKIIALIRNTGSSDMHFRMKRSASLAPSENYYQIGKMGLARFFSSKPSRRQIVKPGETILVDPSLNKQVAAYNELVHGLYEFEIDQPGEVSVLQISPESNYKEAASRIKHIVPPAHVNAGRGVFSPADYQVKATDTLDTSNGAYVLTIADGKKDPWVVGRESNFNNPVELAGNYGVMYDIVIPWKSTDGRALALLTWNPFSGKNQWCDGMANSMVVSKGKFNAGVVVLPSDSLSVKKSPDAILVQVFPAQKGVQYIHLKYSPPGASCLPTPLVFIPVE